MPIAISKNQAGVQLPSAISRDLRMPSPRPSKGEQSNDSLTNNAAPPLSPFLLPTPDGQLSKICGSLVESEDKRQRWACSSCKTVFARDATIFLGRKTNALEEASKILLNTDDEHFCKSCYAQRFSLGQCFACQTPVLGSTKEDGKFVKSGIDNHIWHGRCWNCNHCFASSKETEITIGLDGKPTCDDCFDQPSLRGDGYVPPIRSTSPFKESRSTATALSGSASRQGMGATIAELSRKFGQSPAVENCRSSSPTREHSRPPISGRQSPIRQLTRSNSITGGARPLTAQFSGQGFNLAAFKPTTPILGRSDSRSRNASPIKDFYDEQVCAKCFKGAFDGFNGDEIRMISLQGGAIVYHVDCFCCTICEKSLENASRSLVRLQDGSYAHPACAGPATIERKVNMEPPTNAIHTGRANSTSLDHVTHQRLPRPSLVGEVQQNLPISYLNSAKVKDNASITTNVNANRRFQPTSGAAPPTRSTLIQPSKQNLNRIGASLAISSSPDRTTAKFNRLGGMQKCGGCENTVSSLEGVPGPRGQTWHRKCLICSAPSNSVSGHKKTSSICSKQLDSSAKVNYEGELRCRECFDYENALRRQLQR